MTLDSLRDQIAMVLQHNLVFHDTVANNIGCGDPAYTLPQIIEAAKMAHAHQFIQKLPQGYETPIGELGHSLTLSEQFRIALARADPARPGPAHHRGAGDAAGRGHQGAARRHAGARPAGADGDLPAAPHLDDPLVRPAVPAAQGPDRGDRRPQGAAGATTRCTATCTTWSSTRSPSRCKTRPRNPGEIQPKSKASNEAAIRLSLRTLIRDLFRITDVRF